MALHLAVVGGIAGDEHNVAPVILGDLAEGGLQHLGALREQLLTFGVGRLVRFAGSAGLFGIIMDIGNDRQGQWGLFCHMDASRLKSILSV